MRRIALSAAFDRDEPVVGMLHLPPLPGSPDWGGSMDEVVQRVLRDAERLEEGGLDGLLVENFGDAPFVPGRVAPETVASMARVAAAVREATALPLGVNVLRNDARAALGVAAAVGAHFIRVNVHAGVMLTDQGTLEGRAHETLRARRVLGVPVAVLTDVLVKHAVPPPGLTAAGAARDLWHRGGADALVVSGRRTGGAVDPGRLREVREAVPEAPVWVGSGATAETVAELLPLCDGLIVGSALRARGRAGEPVEADRVGRFMEAVERARG